MSKRWLFWINGVLIVALCATLAPQPAYAVGGLITVTTPFDEYNTDPDTCSLREAVRAANDGVAFNGCAAGDTIQLTGGETYTLELGGSGENSTASGDLDVLTSLTMTTDTGASATIEGGEGWNDRILDLPVSGITVTVSNVNFANGQVVGFGGAIQNNGSRLTLNSVTIRDSQANFGGGLANRENSVTVIAQSLIHDNLGTNTGSVGGGIHNRHVLTITNSAIFNNDVSLGFGGGLAIGVVPGGLTHLKNVTISGNTAGGDGGGIYIDSFGGLVANNVTITNNTADVDATDDGDGGGINVTESRPTLSNSILAGNFDNSPASNVHPDCSRPVSSSQSTWITSQGYNLFGDFTSSGTNCAFTSATGDQIGTASPLNPGLQALANNGSGRLTHALLGNSLALNTGNPATPTGASFTCETADQRGVTRLMGRCDIGAFELRLTLYLPLIQR